MRWRGTVTAPVTGDYTFSIASDDQSQLWLGTSADKFTRRKIACVNSFTAYRNWTASSTQTSGVIPLQAGQAYYIEVVMNEVGGSDNLSVGWKTPGSSVVEIIPGKLPDGTVVLTSYTPQANDADDDGLPDSWELGAGLNPADNGSINNGDGGYSDSDGDGLTNYEEWQTQGDPFTVGGNVGIARREAWSGLSGSAVTSLASSVNFPKAPQIASWLTGA